ncbi:MAG: UDP-N-acetylmuramoyl-L-alanine--D-glutamate ligase, partial [Pseudomonadota bacterium]
QLDLTQNAIFSIACLLNMTPDHLDRHGGMEGYIAAKKRIFRRGAMPQHAVIGIDSAPTVTIAGALEKAGHWQVTKISSEGRVDGGVYVLNGVLYDDLDGLDEAVCDLMPIQTLPGYHNWQNAAAAYACCRHLGLEPDVIAAGLASFPGLAHRQQIVARYKRINFVNDSKATNADAASKALGSYPRIFWIAGGKAKDGGLNGLERLMDRVRHAYLIGDAANDFSAWCEGKCAYSVCHTMDKAVSEATALAVKERKESVILLSPACASFDQFESFEQRGEVFAATVEDVIRTRQQMLEAQQ